MYCLIMTQNLSYLPRLLWSLGATLKQFTVTVETPLIFLNFFWTAENWQQITLMLEAFTLTLVTACTQFFYLICSFAWFLKIFLHYILKLNLSETEDQNISQCRVHKALKSFVKYFGAQSSGVGWKLRWLSWVPSL